MSAEWAGVAVGILATILAAVALFHQHRSARRQAGIEAVQLRQAQAITDLLELERGRVERDQAANEEARSEDEVRRLSADLGVMQLVPRPTVGRQVRVMNAGAHRARLLEVQIWPGERDDEAAVHEVALPADGLCIEPGEQRDLKVPDDVGDRAWCRLVWTDGHDDAWEVVHFVGR